ncbi:MAG: hypothetical protein ACREU3_11505 [Steroidobacteraceae bacterium]
MKKLAVIALIGSLAVASVALAASPRCGSIAFVGKLEWTKLYPRNEYVAQAAASNGNLQISTTNSCGKAETKFSVTRLLAGPALSSLVVTSDLSEECKPPVSLSQTPTLISATKEQGKWVIEAVAPVTIDKAGNALILPGYPQDFLGVSTDEVRQKLNSPIFMADAQGIPRAYLNVMEKRGVLKQSGKGVYYVSGVYLKALQKALREKADLQECLPN